MTNRINVLGNGNHAGLFTRGTEGTLLICNMKPMELPQVKSMRLVWWIIK